MDIAQPFHDGLKKSRLLLPWCKSCKRPHFYPRSACPQCWSEEGYDWRLAAGTGVVHTFTIVRANPPPSFVPLLPYPIVVVDLEEGVRMLSNIVGEYEGLAIGDKVQVEFVTRGNDTLPMFRRVT